jgi:hypothetical protein
VGLYSCNYRINFQEIDVVIAVDHKIDPEDLECIGNGLVNGLPLKRREVPGNASVD